MLTVTQDLILATTSETFAKLRDDVDNTRCRLPH